MAIVTLEGLLEIDLADVYAWLGKTKVNVDDARGMEFSVDLDALLIHQGNGRPPVEVPSEDLWCWIADAHLPKDVKSWEYVFGVPAARCNDGVLRITFAASNSTDPRTWKPAPACLREWPQWRDSDPATAPVRNDVAQAG